MLTVQLARMKNASFISQVFFFTSFHESVLNDRKCERVFGDSIMNEGI
jgi:hypothetical protein